LTTQVSTSEEEIMDNNNEQEIIFEWALRHKA